MTFKLVFTLLLFLPGILVHAGERYLLSPFEKASGWGQGLTTADFNGDGKSDLVVLAPGYHNSRQDFLGVITLYYGRAEGFNHSPDLIFEPGLPGFGTGASNSASGDFNNDGFDDLVVSNPFYGEPQLDRGFVQLFPGSAKGLDKNHSLIKTGPTAYGSYGSHIACLDFNADGIDDLLVESRFAEILEGRIYLYCGGKEFSLETPDFSLKIENSQSLYFGLSTDFNNDGAIDLICRTNNNWNAGKSQYYIFQGGRKPELSPMKKFETNQFTPQFYLAKNKVFVGTGNSENGMKSMAIRMDDWGVSKIPWEIPGIPLQLSGNSFAVINDSDGLFLRIFTVEGNNIREKVVRKLPPAGYSGWPPRILRAEPGKELQLILPVTIKGKETLSFTTLAD
jgi:hypothetical protein